jgi:hypothetical protein
MTINDRRCRGGSFHQFAVAAGELLLLALLAFVLCVALVVPAVLFVRSAETSVPAGAHEDPPRATSNRAVFDPTRADGVREPNQGESIDGSR